MEEASFISLPEDILVNIFGRLDDYPCELPRLACVCSRFASLIASRCWKLKCLSAAPSLVADLLQPCVGEAHGFQDLPGGWSALHKLLFCCPGLLHAGVRDRAPGFLLGFPIASHALNGSAKHLSSNVEKRERNVDTASCSLVGNASFGYGEANQDGVRCAGVLASTDDISHDICFHIPSCSGACSDNQTSGWKDASGHDLASRQMIEDGCARSMGRTGHGNELHDFALNMDKTDAGVWDSSLHRAVGFPLGFAMASQAFNGSSKHLSLDVEKPERNVDAASCSFGYGEAASTELIRRDFCFHIPSCSGASSDNQTSFWKDVSGHDLASRQMIEDGCARSMGRICHGNEVHDFALNMDKSDCDVSAASGSRAYSARQISDQKVDLCQDEIESQINEAGDFGSIQRICYRNELRDLRIDAADVRKETRLDTYKQAQMAQRELGFENQSKRRKTTRDGQPHLASGMWRFSREQGNKLLANRYRADSLYICDWPGCIHPGEKRNYKLFRGIFKKFKSSYVWKNLMDMKAPKSNMSCAFCSSESTWDMVANFCLKRSIGSHKDGEPFVWAYVCENGHVAGAWTDRPLYNLQIC